MKLYNYKVFNVATVLDSKVLIPAENLAEFINGLSPNKTLYHCFYNLEQREKLAQYEGFGTPVFDTIHLDFDSKDDGGKLAHSDTERFVARLHESGYEPIIYFSGNKGFHLAIHMTAFNIFGGDAKILQNQVRSLVHNLKLEYPTLDPSIHNPTRLFRAYRSCHEKSKLYKIRLTPNELHTLSLDQIREKAKEQPSEPMTFPLASAPIPWLVSSINATSSSTRSVTMKEIAPGNVVQDELAHLKSYPDKKCIKRMEEGEVPPTLNRHNVELCLIYNYRMQGLPLEKTLEKMRKWTGIVYAGEPDRAKDCVERQVPDAYKKDIEKSQLYDFGCYGDIKKAYCSAKCSIYKSLKPDKRATPPDCTDKQAKENMSNGIDPLSEGQMADKILSEMPELISLNDDYFQWTSTHWKRLDRGIFNSMLNQAAILIYENKAPSRIIASLVTQIKNKIKVAPEKNHLYSCAPNKFNFTDGTCWVEKNEKGLPSLVMREHRKEDYLGSCAPFPLFAEHKLPRSGDFLHYIEARRQAFDAESFEAFQEMYGAALVPFIPRIFFLYGESDSGKSTSAILLSELLGEQNVANVVPTGDYMFGWEEAIGKIANIVTELKGKDPLKDDRLKEIRDKKAVLIQRKNRPGVRALLPFLHIYCCNKIPPSLEGNTGALDRRMTLLTFVKGPINGFDKLEGLGQWLWERDAGNVLDFAREGLAKLVKNEFRYSVPEASRKALAEWQEETDPVKIFVKEVESGEQPIAHEGSKDGRVLGKIIHDAFTEWTRKNGHRMWSKNRLYKELERCGVKRALKTNTGQSFYWSALRDAGCEF